MKTVFDSSYPAEQMTAEFWETVIMGAFAEWVLEQMEAGRFPPPDTS